MGISERCRRGQRKGSRGLVGGAVLRAIVVASAGVLAGAAPAAAQTRPNIVFVLADDHAAHAVSAYREYLPYGARLPGTPNLDRLAKEGMLFVNAFVTNSICGPSRAAVLTGQYGHLNGVMVNGDSLHPTAVTFPGLLRDAGYATAIFGKWHLQTAPSGFTHFELLHGQGPYYNPVLNSESDTARYTGYTPDIITDRALKWLAARKGGDRPFVLMLQFNAAHRYWDAGPAELDLYRDTLFAEPPTFWDNASGRATPAHDPEMKIALDLFARDLKLEVPADLTDAQRAAWHSAYDRENEAFRALGLEGDALTRWKYQRFIKDYMRTIASVDSNVGRVLDALDRSGLARNTVVVYTSDQGFLLGDHGWFDKRWMYEESLRTPLLVRWPGVVAPGSVNRELVMNLDFAETLLDVGGVDVPDVMQGASLVPLLRGETPEGWRDAIYYQYFEYPGWHMVQRQYGVRTDRYKLIHYYEAGEWELFDLVRDPEELHSVYAHPEYTEVVADLKTKLTSLRQKYGAPAKDPVPHVPFNPPPEIRRDTTGG